MSATDKKLQEVNSAVATTVYAGTDIMYIVDSSGGTDEYMSLTTLFGAIVTAVVVGTTNGIDCGDGTAADQDLLTVRNNVGTGKIWWDDTWAAGPASTGALIFSNLEGGVVFSSNAGINIGSGSTGDQDLITVEEATADANKPKFWWDESETQFSFTVGVIFQSGAVTIKTANGLDFTPSSDIDTDILTLNVTGTPKLWWDEVWAAGPGATGALILTGLEGGLVIDSANGLNVGSGAAADQDLITVEEGTADASKPRLWWDESENAFSLTQELNVTDLNGIKVPVGANNACSLHVENTDAGYMRLYDGAVSGVRITADSGSTNYLLRPLEVASANGINIGTNAAADQDLITVDEGTTDANRPRLWWDESATAFSITLGLNVTGVGIFGTGGGVIIEAGGAAQTALAYGNGLQIGDPNNTSTTVMSNSLNIFADVAANKSHIACFSTDAAATGKGASLILGGESGEATTPFSFGTILGAKDAAGTYGGYISLSTTATGSASTERLRINATGDVIIGTAGVGPSANSGKVLAFEDNTANPTMTGLNISGIYGKDNSGNVELWGTDEGGTAGKLAPHMPIDQAEAAGIIIDPDDPFPEVSYHVQPYLGYETWKYFRMDGTIQRITRKIPLAHRRNWNDDQQKVRDQSIAERKKWEENPRERVGKKPKLYEKKKHPLIRGGGLLERENA